jgi:hypothetical protein
MSRAQLEMFGTQEELLDAAPPVYRADTERVRARLAGMLDEVRNAGEHGLEQSRRRFFETVVPQMTRWLPKDEAEQFQSTFIAALENVA